MCADRMQHAPGRDNSRLKLQISATLALVICFCLAGTANAALANPQHARKLLQSTPTRWTVAAQELCATPEFTSQQCGLAEDSEEVVGYNCLMCGSMWRSLPGLPAEIIGHNTYFQIGVRLLSLTCNGTLVVRSVFKMHEGYNNTYAGANCTNAGLQRLAGEYSGAHAGRPLSGNDSAVIRCELELPDTGGTEAERALLAKEGRCWECGRCSVGMGCPNRYGVWYSDTFTTVAKGCDFDPKGEYEARKVGFMISLQTKVLLAKFEACNNLGCFDAGYEEAKQRTARPCVNGTCAE